MFAAAVISFFVGQTVNAYFILAVLLINASIGTFQEYSAEQAASALRKLVPHFANVVRDGTAQRIDATEVVPDDVMLLESGDKVSADLHMLQTRGGDRHRTVP